MREAIGGTWLFGLVITFIVFFASFLALSINYAKAFNVKNEIVDLISKYEGNSQTTREKISDYLYKEGYMVLGDCEDGYTGYVIGESYGPSYETPSGSKSYYCVKNIDISSSSIDGETPIPKSYYKVEVFFKVDLPVIGAITNFSVKGETESIFYPKNS